jgi:proline dehydrogenase
MCARVLLPAGMAARGLSPSGGGVYFGQLLGMSDNLTFTLGQHGYEAFKYVPYG